VRFDDEEEEDDDDEFPDDLLNEDELAAYQQAAAASRSKGSTSGKKGRQTRGARGGGDDAYDGSEELGELTEAGAVDPLSAEAREALELQFERAMLEYEDEDIGYLSEVCYFIGGCTSWCSLCNRNRLCVVFCVLLQLEEEEIGGNIDLAEDMDALNYVCEDFLQVSHFYFFVLRGLYRLRVVLLVVA
jgi:hypothetical protein